MLPRYLSLFQLIVGLAFVFVNAFLRLHRRIALHCLEMQFSALEMGPSITEGSSVSSPVDSNLNRELKQQKNQIQENSMRVHEDTSPSPCTGETSIPDQLVLRSPSTWWGEVILIQTTQTRPVCMRFRNRARGNCIGDAVWRGAMATGRIG